MVSYNNVLRARFIYLTLIVFTIVLGLLSRHITGIPLFIGDILWALMVFFIIRVLFIMRSIKWVAIASLLFCYAIEFSQLYKAPWINNLRHTLFGRLVLGDTFLWVDMLCYTISIGAGILLDIYLRKVLAAN